MMQKLIKKLVEECFKAYFFCKHNPETNNYGDEYESASMRVSLIFDTDHKNFWLRITDRRIVDHVTVFSYDSKTEEIKLNCNFLNNEDISLFINSVMSAQKKFKSKVIKKRKLTF